jgi:hypothetical protein
MTDDRPPLGEPQDDMAVTDRQWTYHVVGHWSSKEAQRLVAISTQSRELAQSREAEGGSDAENGE